MRTKGSGWSQAGNGSGAWAGPLSALLVLLILGGTLLPVPLPRTGAAPPRWHCFLCGGRDLADALSNVVLFVPLGASLVLAVGSRVRAVLLMAALSAAIEVAQTLVPGRFPSLSDVLFNTCGGWVGAGLVVRAHLWMRPDPRTLRWLRAGSLAGALAVVAATGFLNRPSLPESRYFVQWTADLGNLERYEGRVLEASLGGSPSGPGIADARVAAELARGAPLRVRFEAGARPGGLAPLWTVYDERGREIALLGVDRSDLVLRVRRRADDVRLDRMDTRLAGALRGIEPGDLVTARAWRDERGTPCLAAHRTSRCGPGVTAGTGWALLHYSERMPAGLVSLLGPLWMAVLFVPWGFYGARATHPRRPALRSLDLLLVTGALLLLPGAVGLASTPAVEIVGATSGMLVGVALGWLLWRTGARAADRSGEGPAEGRSPAAGSPTAGSPAAGP